MGWGFFSVVISLGIFSEAFLHPLVVVCPRPRNALEGGGVPPAPPPGRRAYAQPLSP